eukprot:98292-Rhodomonas_salina.2
MSGSTTPCRALATPCPSSTTPHRYALDTACPVASYSMMRAGGVMFSTHGARRWQGVSTSGQYFLMIQVPPLRRLCIPQAIRYGIFYAISYGICYATAYDIFLRHLLRYRLSYTVACAISYTSFCALHPPVRY